jgi:5'-methylthioadenosine phosphorylase
MTLEGGMAMTKGLVGIIGGSGLYSMEGVRITDEKRMETPFGMPSDAILIGELEGRDVAFLPRHGRGHTILPHEINYRANIFAMKELGVDTIISVSAVGSMKDGIQPGDLVIVDQFVDRTKVREQTFFGCGVAAHVSFADPVCGALRKALINGVRSTGSEVHEQGTYVCIEGPMFSSRAESNIYRSWGVDVIGMTNYQEAKLAREAEICYGTIALATDYDCWHMHEEAVDVATVVKTLQDNVSKAQNVIRAVLPNLSISDDCPCRHALDGAIMTDKTKIPADIKKKLAPIIGKYIS